MLKVLLIGPVIGLALAGCNTVSTPIVAVAADDIGVVARASPQAQGAVSLSVGYKGAKFAVLPVENRDGDLLAMDTAKGEQTYSIFTQLGLDARAGAATRGVAVEQVLAVGPAADKWVAKARPFPATPGGPN